MHDPVCGMDVDIAKAEAEKLYADYEGKRYYFCMSICLQVFLMDPPRFVAHEEPELASKVSSGRRAPKVTPTRLLECNLLPWLKQAVEQKASDLFLTTGKPPTLQIFGTFKPLNEFPLPPDCLSGIINTLLPELKREQFRDGREVDLGFGIKGLSRFRANIFRTQDGDAMAIRPIPWKIPTLDELGLPPVFHQLSKLPRGLILVTGPAGCGKSTTLASFVDTMNRQEERHIVTIEDPIEYVIPNQRSIVHQREVGLHTRSFADALRSALRENPNVIMVGELRDFETISLAIRAAETGHLVLGTLHSGNTIQSITRILDVFEADLQSQIRIQVAQSLKTIISQRLLKRLDRKGMIVATEVLINTSAIQNLIRLNKVPQIQSYLQTGMREGMHTLEVSIRDLVNQGIVAPTELRETGGL